MPRGKRNLTPTSVRSTRNLTAETMAVLAYVHHEKVGMFEVGAWLGKKEALRHFSVLRASGAIRGPFFRPEVTRRGRLELRDRGFLDGV